MEFLNIKLNRNNTLEVKYKNVDGDVISMQGANIVHKDLKRAMNNLIPHMAIVTEQREAMDRNLKQVQADKITDEGNDSVFKRLTVDSVQLSENENTVTLTGCRLLLNGGICKLVSPVITLSDSESYTYADDLAVDIDALKYEVKAYIEERKWGVKEAEIAFDDPFNGVEADAAPEVGMQVVEPKKRGRKPKKAA